MALERIEVVGPVTAVPGDPLVDLHKSVSPQRIDAALGVGSYLDEADLAKHP